MKASFAAIFRRGGSKAELFGTSTAAAGGAGGAGGGGKGGASPSSAPQQEPVAADALLVSRKLDELCAAWSQPRGGRGMAAGVWRPEAGAVEVVSKGKHTFQSIGFWAHPPGAGQQEAAATTTTTTTPADGPAATTTTTTTTTTNTPRRLYLHIEDAVTMLDAGELMLFAEEKSNDDDADAKKKKQKRRKAAARAGTAPRLRLLSLQEAHRLSATPLRVSGARLSLRAHLGRLGYAVGRFPARWALRAGEEPGAPWRGERGGGWAGCDGRAGERGATAIAAAPPSPKRRRRGAEEDAEIVAQDGDAATTPPRRGWWPAVGDAAHPWLSCGGGGHGQPPPRDLPTALSVPNWRYEAWLCASAAAAGLPPPQLPLPARDATPLPHPGRALNARFPLLRPLRALSDADLGLDDDQQQQNTQFSPPPPPVLPVLYDVHSASASFSVHDPGRPAFRVGLAPEGEAAMSWALPPLRDVAASEQAARRGVAGSTVAVAGAARPVPVRWAAVLAGGDVAFFSVEGARLLDQQGVGAAAAGATTTGAG